MTNTKKLVAVGFIAIAFLGAYTGTVAALKVIGVVSWAWPAIFGPLILVGAACAGAALLILVILVIGMLFFPL